MFLIYFLKNLKQQIQKISKDFTLKLNQVNVDSQKIVHTNYELGIERVSSPIDQMSNYLGTNFIHGDGFINIFA